MKKFFARLFIIISFLAAMVMVFPFKAISFIDISGFEYDIKNVYIPIGIAAISLIMFIVGIIDKSKNGRVSRSVIRATYLPLIFYTIASFVLVFWVAISMRGSGGTYVGIDNTLVLSIESVKRVYYTVCDGLLKLFNKPLTNVWIPTLVLAGGFSLLTFLFGHLFTRKLYKRNLFVRFLVYILFLVFSFLAFEFVPYAFFNGQNTPNISFGSNMSYAIIAILALSLVLCIIHIIIIHKKDKKDPEAVISKKKKDEKDDAPDLSSELSLANFLAETKKEKESEQEEIKIDDPISELPAPEEVLETVLEEKTVVHEIIHEVSDLDSVFDTEFGFRYTSVVKKEASSEYYVNKQPFLVIRNNGKEMSFRLELDKAIRLIIQFPLIGKDKYENHKLWFKLENIDLLTKEKIVEIIKAAYETVLNNR